MCTHSVFSGLAQLQFPGHPQCQPAWPEPLCVSVRHAGTSGPPAHCEHPLSSQLFHRCQRAVQALPSRARRACSEQEERLLRNVVASLAQALQELSTSFRHAQSSYLRRECPPAPGSQVTSVPVLRSQNNSVFLSSSSASSPFCPLLFSWLAFAYPPPSRGRR